MLKDVGLLINCGRWRLERETKSESVALNFVVSIEVLESESPKAIDELRLAIQDTVGRWSLAGWRKIKRQERKQKNAMATK